MTRITLDNLFACTPTGGRFVAEAADGRLVHVSEVPSGLRCDCRCPGCGRRMVAKRGPIQTTHHFAHESDKIGRTCTTAGETALHMFAKAVLNERLELFLPELAVVDGMDRLPLSRERTVSFDEAILEERGDGIVPDVTCLLGERRLIVEFKVTHPCGEEKIARLRDQNRAAIEIDLSAYRAMPLESLAEPILFEAPRAWLHSPRIEDGLTELERRRLERLKARAVRIGIIGRRYAAACEEVLSMTASGPALHSVTADGLGHAVGIEVPGFGCFTVAPGDWQAALLAESLEFGLAGRRPFLTKDGCMKRLRRWGWIRPGFADVSEDEADGVQLDGTAFYTPAGAVEAWLGTLAATGMAEPADGRAGWFLKTATIGVVGQARHRRTEPDRRLAELRGIVDDLLSDLPPYEVKGFSFERWARVPIPGRTYSAEQAVRSGEPDFADLNRALSDLRQAMRNHPREGMDLMGLPLSGALWRTLERKRREDVERERARQAQDVRGEDERVERILAHARRKLGDDGNGWAITRSADLGGRSPVEAAREAAAGLASAMRLADDEADRREREVRATLTTSWPRIG